MHISIAPKRAQTPQAQGEFIHVYLATEVVRYVQKTHHLQGDLSRGLSTWPFVLLNLLKACPETPQWFRLRLQKEKIPGKMKEEKIRMKCIYYFATWVSLKYNDGNEV